MVNAHACSAKWSTVYALIFKAAQISLSTL